jgi:hypothetical protein
MRVAVVNTFHILKDVQGTLLIQREEIEDIIRQ